MNWIYDDEVTRRLKLFSFLLMIIFTRTEDLSNLGSTVIKIARMLLLVPSIHHEYHGRI